MKLKGPSMIDTIGLSLLHKAVAMGTLLGSLLCAGGLIYLAEKYSISILRAMAGLVFLSGLFLSFFTCREIIERMRQDSAMLFVDAVKHTFFGYLTLLCFLPLIGPPLTRFVEKKKPSNPFIADES
jgi:hypothetical protein